MADLVTIGFRADTGDLTRAQRELEKTAKAGASTDKGVKGLSTSFTDLAASIGLAGAAMAGLRKTIDIARQFDILNASLETATGSAERAQMAFYGIQKLATETPYDLAQVTTAFVKLKNLGLDPSREALISYGNTAAAMGKSLDQFIEAVADAATAEFERLKEFGIKAKNQGDTIAFTFRGVTKEVKNNAESIERYLMDLGNVEFAGAMEKRMATLDGAISNLGDAWDAMFLQISNNGVGDAVEKTVRTATDYIGQFTEFMNQNGHEIEKIGIAIASGLQTTFVKLGGFFDILGEEIKFAISNPIDFIKGKIIDLLQFISSLGGAAMEFLGFDAAITSKLTMQLERFRGVTVTAHNQMLQQMRSDTAQEVAGIESIYFEMFTDVEKRAKEFQIKRKEMMEADPIFTQFEEIKEVPKWMQDAGKKIDKEADEWSKITERAADRIDQAFVDVFMNIGDGFSSLTNGLKNAFKQMLAEMAVQAMKANFLNPLMGGISGLGFGGTAGLLGGLSNSFGALGGLFSGGLAGLSLGGIGAALPAIGLIAGGTSLVNSLTGGGLFGTSYKATGNELNLGFGSGGAFGSTVLEESKKRALFGGTKRRYTTTGIDTSGIDAAFDAVQQSILQGAELLGVGTAEAALSNFTAALKTDITGKSEAEVQQIINEWISSTTSSMVGAGLGSALNEFQKEGEPLTETLMRVVTQTEVFNSVIDSLWLNFEGTGKAAAMAADNLVNLVGGLDQFSALNNQLMSFAGFQDQWVGALNDLVPTFNQLGLAIPDTREQFFDLMQGIDLSSESGQALYATLLKLVPTLDKWYSLEDEKDRRVAQKIEEANRLKEQQLQLEQRLNDQRKNLTIQLLEAQGKSEEALALAREMELATLDPTLRALMQQIYAEQDRQKAIEASARAFEENKAKEIEIVEKQKEALNELYNTLVANVEFAESEVEKARQKELERLDLVITKAEEAYNLELEAINKQREEYNKLIDNLTAKADSAANMLQSSLSVELAKYDELARIAQEQANSEIALVSQTANARLSALSAERGILEQIASQYGAASRGVTAAQALAAARGGNFEPATRINAGGDYSDSISARIGAAREAFALAEIGKLADSQLSDTDKQIQSIESSSQAQIDAINALLQSNIEQIEADKQAVEQQVKELLGIDGSVLSLDAAMAAYQKAQDELQTAIASDTLAQLQLQEDAALEQLNAIIEQTNQEADLLNKQIDELLNIDNSVMELQSAIDLLLSERQALAELEYDKQIEDFEAQLKQIEKLEFINDSVQEVVAAVSGLSSSIGGLTAQIPDPNDKWQTPPIIILPPVEESATDKKIDKLTESVTYAQQSIAKSSATTAKILQRIELDGLQVIP